MYRTWQTTALIPRDFTLFFFIVPVHIHIHPHTSTVHHQAKVPWCLLPPAKVNDLLLALFIQKDRRVRHRPQGGSGG